VLNIGGGTGNFARALLDAASDGDDDSSNNNDKQQQQQQHKEIAWTKK
jgi:hypothetical protein